MTFQEEVEVVLKEELEWLERQWDPGGYGFRMWLAGSDRAHRIIGRMIHQMTQAEADSKG